MAKWVLFTLLLLNLFLYLTQWANKDQRAAAPSYIEVEGAEKILFVGEKSEGNVSGESKDSLCLLVGPLESDQEAQSLRALLARSLIESSVINQVLDKAPGYWVYFGPLGSLTEARAKLAEFQAKRIDSFVIGRGPYKNGISLGVFDNVDSARRMKADFVERGYDVQIGEKKKSESEFWLGINLPYTIENNKKISDLAASKNVFPEMRQIFCKSIASP